MGLDLYCTLSKTLTLPNKDEETDNEYVGSTFFQYNWHNYAGYVVSEILENNANYVQPDVGTNDFHDRTYIYKYDDFMGLQIDNNMQSSYNNKSEEELKDCNEFLDDMKQFCLNKHEENKFDYVFIRTV